MQAASLLCPAGRRALQPAKNPFLDTLKTVVVDIRFFLFLLLLTVWGFACAFYILFRRDQSKHVRPASITSTTLLSALPRHCEHAGCEAARLNARPPHACKSVLLDMRKVTVVLCKRPSGPARCCELRWRPGGGFAAS